MQTRSQGRKFFATEQDLYSSKGNLDILPYHIRMQIYRIHIESTDDASLLAITQTCRGIYTEIHQEIKNKMIERIYCEKRLVIVSGQDVFRKNLRILKYKGDRYGLILCDRGYSSYIPTAATHNIKPDSDILGVLTSLEVQFNLPNSLYREPFGSSITQMVKQVSSELVRLRELRIHSVFAMGYRRTQYYDTEQVVQKRNLCTVLVPFLLIPTVRQLRLPRSFYLQETKQMLFDILDQLQIKYEIVSIWEEEPLIKLYK